MRKLFLLFLIPLGLLALIPSSASAGSYEVLQCNSNPNSFGKFDGILRSGIYTLSTSSDGADLENSFERGNFRTIPSPIANRGQAPQSINCVSGNGDRWFGVRRVGTGGTSPGTWTRAGIQHPDFSDPAGLATVGFSSIRGKMQTCKKQSDSNQNVAPQIWSAHNGLTIQFRPQNAARYTTEDGYRGGSMDYAPTTAWNNCGPWYGPGDRGPTGANQGIPERFTWAVKSEGPSLVINHRGESNLAMDDLLESDPASADLLPRAFLVGLHCIQACGTSTGQSAAVGDLLLKVRDVSAPSVENKAISPSAAYSRSDFQGGSMLAIKPGTEIPLQVKDAGGGIFSTKRTINGQTTSQNQCTIETQVSSSHYRGASYPYKIKPCPSTIAETLNTTSWPEGVNTYQLEARDYSNDNSPNGGFLSEEHARALVDSRAPSNFLVCYNSSGSTISRSSSGWYRTLPSGCKSFAVDAGAGVSLQIIDGAKSNFNGAPLSYIFTGGTNSPCTGVSQYGCGNIVTTGATLPVGQGEGSVEAIGYDTLGNSSVENFSYKIDSVSPQIASSSSSYTCPKPNVESWKNTPVASCTVVIEDQTSKPNKLEYKIDGTWQVASVTGEGSTRTASIPLQSGGESPTDIRFEDLAGNQTTATIPSANIDAALPSAAWNCPGANSAGWHKADIACTLEGGALSGVASMKSALSADDGLTYPTLGNLSFVSPSPTAATGSFGISNEGDKYKLKGLVENRAGSQKEAIENLKLDKTPPTTSASSCRPSAPNSSGWYNTAVSCTLLGSDSLSRVSEIEGKLSLDGGSTFATTKQSSGSPVTSRALSMSTESNQGANIIVEYSAENGASLLSTKKSYPASGVLKIDLSKPAIENASCTGTGGNNGWYKSNVECSFDVEDALSGPSAAQRGLRMTSSGTYQSTATSLTGEGQSRKASFSVSSEGGEISVGMRASDNAENWQPGSSSWGEVMNLKIDKTAPEDTTNLPSGYYKSSYTLRPTAIDPTSSTGLTLSGIDQEGIQCRLDVDMDENFEEETPRSCSSAPITDSNMGVQYRIPDRAGNWAESFAAGSAVASRSSSPLAAIMMGAVGVGGEEEGGNWSPPVYANIVDDSNIEVTITENGAEVSPAWTNAESRTLTITATKPDEGPALESIVIGGIDYEGLPEKADVDMSDTQGWSKPCSAEEARECTATITLTEEGSREITFRASDGLFSGQQSATIRTDRTSPSVDLPSMNYRGDMADVLNRWDEIRANVSDPPIVLDISGSPTQEGSGIEAGYFAAREQGSSTPFVTLNLTPISRAPDSILPACDGSDLLSSGEIGCSLNSNRFQNGFYEIQAHATDTAGNSASGPAKMVESQSDILCEPLSI